MQIFFEKFRGETVFLPKKNNYYKKSKNFKNELKSRNGAVNRLILTKKITRPQKYQKSTRNCTETYKRVNIQTQF